MDSGSTHASPNGIEVVLTSALDTFSLMSRLEIRRSLALFAAVTLFLDEEDEVGREVRDGTADLSSKIASDRRGLGARRSFLATM
jgi:hypothetical protein